MKDELDIPEDIVDAKLTAISILLISAVFSILMIIFGITLIYNNTFPRAQTVKVIDGGVIVTINDKVLEKEVEDIKDNTWCYVFTRFGEIIGVVPADKIADSPSNSVTRGYYLLGAGVFFIIFSIVSSIIASRPYFEWKKQNVLES